MFKRINVSQAKQLIDENQAVVVDIRDQQSFNQGHIANAIALNNDNVAQFINDADKSLPLLVCCYHGNSSQSAAAMLASQGFDDVYSIDGGFAHWQQEYGC